MELPNPFSNIHLLRESSAYYAKSINSASTGSDDYMTGGDTAMMVDSDGFVLIYAYSGGSNDWFTAVYFDDNILHYMNVNRTFSSTIDMADSLTRLSNLHMVHWLGRGFIVSNMDSSTSFDLSVLFTFLGGYANLNLPKSTYPSTGEDWTRIRYLFSYLPLDEPTNITGLSVNGIGNDAILTGFLRITSPQRIQAIDTTIGIISQLHPRPQITQIRGLLYVLRVKPTKEETTH